MTKSPSYSALARTIYLIYEPAVQVFEAKPDHRNAVKLKMGDKTRQIFSGLMP
jgi:hypothetical protein